MPTYFDLHLEYLAPLAIAVPLCVLVIFFVLSLGGGSRTKPPSKGQGGRPVSSPAAAVPKQPLPAEPTFMGGPQAAFKNTGTMDIGGFAGVGATFGPADLDTVIDLNRVNAAKAILVVDDSAVPRIKLRKLFEAQGYRVETANDGVQAMDAIARTKFSIIITDLEMPNMDGFQLIAAVQGSPETEDIPLIAITGHEEMQARVNDIQGLYGIFKKPWNDRELLKRVDVLVSLHS